MRATIPFATMPVAAAAIAVALVGCAAPSTPADPGDAAPAPPASGNEPCYVGVWQLDVVDYQAQSWVYLTDLGIPLDDFLMDGAGAITFTADGFVTAEIDLISSGSLVADEVRIPFSQRSAYTGSGDWAPGTEPDTIDFTNWAILPVEGAEPSPDAPAAPTIDFTGMSGVTALCTDDGLTLHGPDAPVSTNWTR